ncbi:mas-related G-protein coupled receptor member X2-like, partial [Trichechus inunguis]
YLSFRVAVGIRDHIVDTELLFVFPGGTTRGFQDRDLNTLDLATEQPLVNSSCVDFTRSAHLWFVILDLLTLIIALCGLVENGIVLWLLGFCTQRNVFSVYVFNLAGLDVLLHSCKAMDSVEDLVCIFHIVAACMHALFMIPVKYFSYTAGRSMLRSISSMNLLSYVNSCISPIIYFFIGCFREQRFRLKQTLKLVLRRAPGNGPEMEDTEGSLSVKTKM